MRAEVYIFGILTIPLNVYASHIPQKLSLLPGHVQLANRCYVLRLTFPVLVHLGLIATVVLSLFFGFSQNYVWAFSTRFVNGLMNGLVATLKATASELVHNKDQVEISG